jgi:hypothetical protein
VEEHGRVASINWIEVEVWTRDEDNGETDDRIDVIVRFADGRSFRQRLADANNNFERRQRERFTLDLAAAAEVVAGQTPESLSAITLIKASGTNMWKCEAVGVRVNDAVVLTRYVAANLDVTGDQVTIARRQDGGLDGLELWLETADVPNGDTDDPIYCNVVFSDGATLYPTRNLQLDVGPLGNDFERDNALTSYRYLLPLPASLPRTAAQLAEVYLRKAGSNGWLLKSARLYANGVAAPVLGSSQINQFLDSSAAALGHADWSSRSIGTPSALAAELPWPTAPGASGAPRYQLSGPVLGHLSFDSARVLYRVEDEGPYRLKLFSAGGALLGEQTLTLAPTGTFVWTRLTADTHYRFRFFRVTASGGEVALPEGDGELRTAPPDGASVKMSVGIGSCCRNSKNPAQPVWARIRELALDPAQDPASATNDLRFFLHMGDTFYLYDDVVGEPQPTTDHLSTIASANLSSRKHAGFLQMARRVPCYAVWDDHDFRFNNKDSSGYSLKEQAREVFLSYWGNPAPASAAFGLATRWSYGNIDFYLLDGRFARRRSEGVLFGAAQWSWVIGDIAARGPNRMRVLVSGSTWNHTQQDADSQAYGSSVFTAEREAFYAQLGALVGPTIKGLVLLSGDIHRHEIYEVALPAGGTKVAPELVCSPLAYNAEANGTRAPTGERKASAGDRSGFASLHFDTRADPWTLTVRYRLDTTGAVFLSKTYTLGADGQFRY